MHDRVDLRRLDNAAEDRIALVGSHELGSLELNIGFFGAEADDDVDIVFRLEELGHAGTPKGAEAGDQDATAHQPNQTDRRVRNMS